MPALVPKHSPVPAFIPELSLVNFQPPETSINRATKSESPAIMSARLESPEVIAHRLVPNQIVPSLDDSEFLLSLIILPITAVDILCVWDTHSPTTHSKVEVLVPKLPVCPDMNTEVILEFSFCQSATQEGNLGLLGYPEVAVDRISCFPVFWPRRLMEFFWEISICLSSMS